MCVGYLAGRLVQLLMLLMLSPNLSKTLIPYVWWRVGGGGGDRGPGPMFELLMLSPNLLTPKIPFLQTFAENFLICVMAL